MPSRIDLPQVEGGFLPDDKYETIKDIPPFSTCRGAVRTAAIGTLSRSILCSSALQRVSAQLCLILVKSLQLLIPVRNTCSFNSWQGEELPMIVSNVCEAIIAHQARFVNCTCPQAALSEHPPSHGRPNMWKKP